jgi:hypothetical protein
MTAVTKKSKRVILISESKLLRDVVLIYCYAAYSSKFSTVNAPGFTGQGTLVYLDNGAQYEFIGTYFFSLKKR